MFETSVLQNAPEEQIHDGLSRYVSGGQKESFLIAGASGMGKTSLLASCVRHVRQRGRVVSISGSVLASEGHFVHVLHSSMPQLTAEHRDWKSGLRALLAGSPGHPLILAIDDFDQLAYKRDELGRILAASATDRVGVLLLLTGARSTVDRITGTGRPFASVLTTVLIEPMDEAAAENLIRLRTPGLSQAARMFVVRQAGGHPGAIVFLSRIVESIFKEGDRFDASQALSYASEFAGAVYAEPWSALGPQQRAILWHLSSVQAESASATHIARELVLQPSHVSAQLARLVDEGLIRRDGRGAYAIAPLLASWIVARGPRASIMTDSADQPCARSRGVE